MKRYKGAVFFDLDGTLLDSMTDSIQPSALRAIGKLKQNNYLVCLSTGRDMETHYSRKYLDMLEPDAVIHLNGNKITIEGKDVFIHEMEKDLLSRVLDYAEANGFCVGTSIGDLDYFTIPELKTKADLSYRNESVRHFTDVSRLLSDELKVMALSFAGEDIRAIRRRVENDFPELSLYCFNNGTGADVVESGFSKADGLRMVCDYCGIPVERTYAFGDSPNDIEMLEAAQVGIAVGNAGYDVKRSADMVTEDIRLDGIFKALKRLALI